ncbi:MAG: TMEM43 family protein [Roseiflexaceae bacterium]
MSNSYTQTTRNSWGSRITNSFVGVLFGLILIPFSIWGLWWNEGQPDLSVLAQASIAVDASQINLNTEGQFVAATGILDSDSTLADEPWMQSGDFISLQRRVEMYAWEESSSTTETEDTFGGGSTTSTTYTYNKTWTESPANSSSFEYPEGHENPTKPLNNLDQSVENATIGVYGIAARQITLPGGDRTTPKPGTLPDGYVLQGEYIYNRSGAANSPQVGDIRISFNALPRGITVTALGQQQNNQIIRHEVDKQEFYRVFIGTRDQAIETLHTEYLLRIWLIRVFGILGIFIGLNLIVGPIGRIFGVIGILGNAVDGIFGIINAILSITIGMAVIIISQIFHNIWLLLITIALIVAGVVYYLRNRSKKLATNPSNTDATPTDSSPPQMT